MEKRGIRDPGNDDNYSKMAPKQAHSREKREPYIITK
jgi:hypothetical protein